MNQPGRILIIQPAFIGDAILVTSLAESLHAAYPSSEITLLVRAGNEALFHQHPFLKVWVWQKRQKKYLNLWRLLKKIRRARFDLVVNPHRFASSGLLAGYSKATEVRGFEKNPFSRRFTHVFQHEIGVSKSGKFLHEIERNHRLLDGMSIVLKAPKLYPEKAKFTSKENEIIESAKAKPYRCIAPASVWFTKAYPEDRWVELINHLQSERIYLIGAPSDFALAGRMAEAADHHDIINACGQLSLLASAELMRGAVMNYVNDSAPLHLCSAVEARVTAVFCSTIPEFGFGPCARGGRVVEIKEPLACRPCGLHGHNACPEKHFNCAKKIALEDLLG